MKRILCFFAFALKILINTSLHAQPRTLLQRDTLPDIGGGGGKNGNLLDSVLIVDSLGHDIPIGGITWDNNRQKLWGGSICGSDPVSVYLIDPSSGLAEYKFSGQHSTVNNDDGIAYDYTDSSIWLSPDVSLFVDHFKDDGTYLGEIFPHLPDSLCMSGICHISGVTVGYGDMLYLGLDGSDLIVQVRKSDGGFISSFCSPGGRDEDLGCDNINFLPKLVIWSRDFYSGTIDAIEVEPGTCKCSGFLGEQELTIEAISIYPNPARNNFLISFPASFSMAECILSIYNAMGETIYIKRMRSMHETINCDNILPGIYFVKVCDEDRVYTQKLVIE